MEKLKTEKIDKVILSKEQWENETGKIKLLELWNCIPFEKQYEMWEYRSTGFDCHAFERSCHWQLLLRFYRKS